MRVIISTVVCAFTLLMVDAVFLGGTYLDALRDFAEHVRDSWR